MKPTMNAGACTAVGPLSEKHYGINTRAHNPQRCLPVTGVAAVLALAALSVTDRLTGCWSFDDGTAAGMGPGGGGAITIATDSGVNNLSFAGHSQAWEDERE